MALTKIINDATQSFRPVLTDKLVLDATPTEGSYNGVTSDGVAKAIAEGGGGGGVFEAEYNVTSYADVKAAYDAGKEVVCKQTIDSTEVTYSLYQFNDTDGFTFSGAVGNGSNLYVRTVRLTTGGTWSANADAARPDSYAQDAGKVLTVGATGAPEWVTPSGGASYSAGAGISINNDTISVNHDNSLSDVAGSLSVEINGMMGTFKILPTASLTMNDTLTISCSSTSWSGVGIAQDNIPGYLRVKLTSVDDSSKYVISVINCRKNNDEIYLDSMWSPYGLGGVTFDTYESAPLSYAFNWGSLTLADIGLTSGNGAYVTLVMCDSSGNQLGSDLTISGLSSSDWTVGSTAAPQKLSVANPVPSTNMVSSGSVLTVGSMGTVEWAAPSGGGDVFWATVDSTSYQDVKDAYDAGKVIIAKDGNTIYTLGRWSLAGGFEFFYASVPNNRQITVFQYTLSAAVFWSRTDCTPIPYYNGASDAGKVLTIGSDGFLTWVTP